jgi:hypothetical protein
VGPSYWLAIELASHAIPETRDSEHFGDVTICEALRRLLDSTLERRNGVALMTADGGKHVPPNMRPQLA